MQSESLSWFDSKGRRVGFSCPRMPEPHHGIERPPTRPTPPPDQFERLNAGWWLVPSCRPKGRGRDVKPLQMAMTLLVLWITAAATMTLANAQEPAISEGERRGLAACLIKCPDGDMKCNNRCISQFQTRGAWSDRARACVRNCRNRNQGATQQAADGISGCSVTCVP